ncbi:serine aminopeptidase domain-containing protein [Crassaminicella thermophila]|nr:alpha/beta hydrolase [Crassaminicella thermophila]
MENKKIMLTKENGQKLFVDIYEVNKSYPNVLTTQFNINIDDYPQYYKPFAELGFNIFAVQLTGSGKSGGKRNHLTPEIAYDDIKTVIDYIVKNYNDAIHMYGVNGNGGIYGQYAVSIDDRIRSCALYGVGLHKDLSYIPNHKQLYVIYPIIKMLAKFFPGLKVNSKKQANLDILEFPNVEKEKELYKNIEEKYIDFWNIPLIWYSSFIGLFLEDDSKLKNKPKCPILMFVPEYDRFFSQEYLNKVYEWFDEPKKKVDLEGACHSFWALNSEEVCKIAAEWFEENP